MITEKTLMRDIYCSSDFKKELVIRLFNIPRGSCFSCMGIAHISLKDACKEKNLNLESVLNEIQTTN
ncbi:hypothetical protein KY343_07185 [Candidatus Woesearchaeota archaeon]|nr:hypothetical protein [Candidatus Woesearchaeota archaeon]